MKIVLIFSITALCVHEFSLYTCPPSRSSETQAAVMSGRHLQSVISEGTSGLSCPDAHYSDLALVQKMQGKKGTPSTTQNNVNSYK